MNESKEEIRAEEVMRDEKEQTIEEVLVGLTSVVGDLIGEFQRMVAMQIVLIKYFQLVIEGEDSD